MLPTSERGRGIRERGFDQRASCAAPQISAPLERQQTDEVGSVASLVSAALLGVLLFFLFVGVGDVCFVGREFVGVHLVR